MPAVRLEYVSAGDYTINPTWTEETNKIALSVIDELDMPMILKAIIANSGNTAGTSNTRETIASGGNRANIYEQYKQVRVIEVNTNRVLFYGKVEKTKPEYSPVYGQTLEIYARDNLNELLKRTINFDYIDTAGYGAGTSRSQFIADIINGTSSPFRPAHAYPGNIGTSDTQKFEVSSQTTEITTFRGRKLGKNALREIAEIASADKITSNSQMGRDYYLDASFRTNQAGPIPDIHYFPRGTIPNEPAGGTILNIRYPIDNSLTENNTIRFMLPDFNFPREAKELITRVRLEIVTSNGEQRVYNDCTLINYSGIAGTFVQETDTALGELITWGTPTANQRARVLMAETFGVQSWIIVYRLVSPADSSQTAIDYATLPGSVITGATSGATATVNTTSATQVVGNMVVPNPGILREAIQQDIEYVLRLYEKPISIARDQVAEVLFHGASEVVRGDFTVLRWPYYIIAGSVTTGGTTFTDSAANFLNSNVRVGDIIRRGANRYTITAVTTTTIEARDTANALVTWVVSDAYDISILVRTGTSVRLINLPTNTGIANQNVAVTKIIYEDGPSTQHANIEVLALITSAHLRGRTLPPNALQTVFNETDDANFQNIGAIGGLPLNAQTVNNLVFTTTPGSRVISWAAQTVRFADNRTQSISIGSYNLATLGAAPQTAYAYIIEGNSTLQVTGTFSDTAGIDRALMVVFRDPALTSEDPLIVSINSGNPITVTGTLIANELSAISANMGVLTAGAIRMPSGTPVTISTAGFTGFILTGERIAGYNAGTLQTEIRSSDGRFYASAGNVIIDATGIQMLNAVNSVVTFRESFNGTIRGALWRFEDAPGVGRIRLDAFLGYNLYIAGDTFINSDTDFYLRPPTGAMTAMALRFYEAPANGALYMGFRAPTDITAVGSVIWVLPNGDGSSGQVLSTSGTANLSWISLGSIAGTITATQHGALASASASHRHPDLTSIGVNDHHNRDHAIDGATHTAGTKTLATDPPTDGYVTIGGIRFATVA